MSKSLGTLTLDLVARTGGFVKGMNRAERESKKWRRQVERDLKKLGTQFMRFAKVSAAAGVAAAGAFTLLAKQGLEYVDAQAKMARQVGATIDGLRGLQIAANDAGINTNTLNGAVDRLNARLGEARQGSGQAYEALKRLGLSADALARMDADQRIATIADRVRELGLDSADTADLLRNLGIRNREMVNLLMAGGDGIRSARNEVDELGLSLSRVDAAKVEKANDALGRIPLLLEPIKNQIAINLADPLTNASGLIMDAAQATDGFKEAIDGAMASAFEGASALLTQIDRLILGLQIVQEFQLKAEAFGGTLNRIIDPFQSRDDMPEAFNDLLALQQDMDRRRSRIANGNAVTGFLDDSAAGIRDSGANTPALDQVAINMAKIIGGGAMAVASAAAVSEDSAQVVSDSLDGVTDSANNAATALDNFSPSKNDTVDDILDRAGEGSTIDAQGLVRDAWGNTLPTLQRELDAELKKQVQDFQSAQNLSAGLQSAAQTFMDGATAAAKAAWSSIQPQSADGFASGGVMPTGEQQSSGWSSIKPQTPEQVASGVAKVQGTATAATSQSGGGGRELGTLRLASEAGGEIDVQGASDELTRWLADTLGGVSAGVSSA